MLFVPPPAFPGAAFDVIHRRATAEATSLGRPWRRRRRDRICILKFAPVTHALSFLSLFPFLKAFFLALCPGNRFLLARAVAGWHPARERELYQPPTINQNAAALEEEEEVGKKNKKKLRNGVSRIGERTNVFVRVPDLSA